MRKAVYVALCVSIALLLASTQVVSQNVARLYGTVTGGAAKAVKAESDGSLSVTVTGTPSFSGAITTTVDAVGETFDLPPKALYLRNTTAAAAGAQQFSPSLVMEGQGWRTDATAASRPVQFYFQVEPVQSTANPTGVIRLRQSVNGGSQVLVGSWFTTTGSNSGSFNTAISGFLGWTSSTQFSAPANGEVSWFNNAGSFNAGHRASVLVEANTATKAPSAVENGEWYTNTGDADGSAITLPDNPTVGSIYSAMVTAAQTITITAAAGETLKFGSSTCGTSLTSNTVGSSVTIVAATGGSGGIWITVSTVGTWVCNA